MSLEIPAGEPGLLPRHALGLPAGSVRALLALSVLGLLWAMVFTAPDKALPNSFVYLQILMLLILAQFFTSHGKNIRREERERSPLGLPGGTIRLLLLAGYGGLAYFLWHTQRAFEPVPTGPIFFLLALVGSAFLVGHVWAWLVKALSGGKPPYWLSDIEAWLALLAVICLIVLFFVHLVNLTLPETLRSEALPVQVILDAIVGFYFGARS
jgi:hypothetical protein